VVAVVALAPSAPFASLGFFGSRRPPSSAVGAAVALALAALRAGCAVFVPAPAGRGGLVAGVALVVGGRPGASVVSGPAGLPPRAALAARAAACCRALAAAPAPLAVCWPGRPAPAGLRPSRSWVSCGSGSWSELALCAGLGCALAVFLSAGAAPPAAWGSWSLVSSGPLAGAWLLAPVAARQPALV
jgi:hypothetical protein